jgi:hypothetical protein
MSHVDDHVWSHLPNREVAERAKVVAKNRELSAKMKETQAAEKERKDELGKTIKQQQQYDRLEKESALAPMSAAGAMDMGATQALQQLYTANGAADGQAVDGLITVRIATPDGQDNLQLKESATFGDLRRQIESELQIPGAVQIIGLGRSCTETVSSDRAKLKSKGVTNGSIVGLKYPGFTRTDKVSPRRPDPYLPRVRNTVFVPAALRLVSRSRKPSLRFTPRQKAGKEVCARRRRGWEKEESPCRNSRRCRLSGAWKLSSRKPRIALAKWSHVTKSR